LQTGLNEPYYVIWPVVLAKGNRQTGLDLIKVLKTYRLKSQYLERYHCTKVLFKLVNLTGFTSKGEEEVKMELYCCIDTTNKKAYKQKRHALEHVFCVNYSTIFEIK
jgi:hypothetical protein